MGLARDLVLGLQGALLVRHAPPALADAFCAARLGEDRGGAFGLLPPGVDTRGPSSRAQPRRRTECLKLIKLRKPMGWSQAQESHRSRGEDRLDDSGPFRIRAISPTTTIKQGNA